MLLSQQQLKSLARSFNRQRVPYRKQQLQQLQDKRVHTIDKYKDSPAKLYFQLEKVERKIQHLQEEIVQNGSLRAKRFWRERGESSPGFLKKFIEQRQLQRFIPELTHPVTSTSCKTPDELTDAARTFYQALYTAEPIDVRALHTLSSTVDSDSRIPSSDIPSIMAEFTIEDLIDEAKRCPHHSSLGMDGLPYQILFHLLHNPDVVPLALKVYNDALLHSLFPASWPKTCMALLPKKGDLKNLSNHRPISLINTDAKIFTRLVNTRLMATLNHLISPQQMGFMPNRFIGENGKIIQTVMSIAVVV